MELATAHALTAFYALSHRIGLLPAEIELLDERGGALTPVVWSETKAMLTLADRADGPTSLELGFDPLIYRWLGIRGEAAFIEHYGMRIDEAVAVDAGCLTRFALSLEQGPGPCPVPLQLPASHAWAARATRLMDQLPGSGGAVLAALERALDGLPWDPETIRPVGEAIARIADLVCDEPRAQAARRLLAMVKDSEPSSSTPSIPLLIASQILTVLHALTHEGLLLIEERALETGFDPSGWPAIAAALREGRFDDVHAPVRLLAVWGAPPDLSEEAVRDCLRRCASELPQLLDELERLWGGRAACDAPDDVARAMAAVTVIRHTRVERAYAAPPGARDSVWFEVHQGARRPATLERADLLRCLRAVLLRCEVDPLAVAAAHLDCANEHQALGDHDETRRALAEAMRWTARYQGEPARRDHGAVCFAQQRWLEGEPDDALRRLRDLDGEKARDLVETIEGRAGAREVLRAAEEEHRRDCTVESWCEVAISHLLAGHSVRAELAARDICEHHPHSGLACHTLASVFEELGLYRYALEPAREALALADDPASDQARLDRLEVHLRPGPELPRQTLPQTDDSSSDLDEPL